jgi:O-antigen/teichoic acid export membrane protein
VLKSRPLQGPPPPVLRNISSNVVGTVLPSLAALLAVPLLLDRLGMEGFGIFSLQVAALFFFGLSDLGISRAIVLLSFDRSYANGWHKPYQVGLRLALFLGAAVVFAAAPVTAWLLHAHPESKSLRDLVVSTVLVFASAGVTLVMQAPRAVLEAQERFVLSNAIRGPAAAAIFLAPLVALQVDNSLTSAAVSLLLTRLLAAGAYFWACGHFTDPLIRERIGREERARLQAGFIAKAGWLGATNLLSMLLAYLDRFILGAVGTTTMVGQYVIAQEVVTKAWISSGAVISAAIPRLVASRHSGSADELGRSIGQMRQLMLIAGVAPAVVLILAGPMLLRLWLRHNFDPATVLPLQVMAIGLGVNTLAQVNFSVLQVLGGERKGAYLQVFNVGVLVAGLAVLVPSWGVPGAAATFTLRLLVDAYVGRCLLTRQPGGQHVGVSAASLSLWGVLLAGCCLAQRAASG